MPTLVESLVLVHALSAAMMAGVVWFVQIVHYPLLAAVPRGAFVPYERAHVRRTGAVVAPIMLVEAAAAVALLVLHRETLAIVGAACLAGVWISTFAIQVPLHRRLCVRFDERDHRRLVASNWLRTALWTVRAVLSIALATGDFAA